MSYVCGLRQAGKDSQTSPQKFTLHRMFLNLVLAKGQEVIQRMFLKYYFKCSQKQKNSIPLTFHETKQEWSWRNILWKVSLWRLPSSNFRLSFPPRLSDIVCVSLLQCPHLPSLCLMPPCWANGGAGCVCCAFLASHCFCLLSLLTATPPPGKGKGPPCPEQADRLAVLMWGEPHSQVGEKLTVSVGLSRAG